MTEEAFQQFVTEVDWTFAKSIPNWPHFYLVENELDEPEKYVAARAFIRDQGYDGHFFDLLVRYFNLGEWTYWSSPLAKPFEEQYMINRCRTEYTWDALSKAGELPDEGFEEKTLNLAPVLEDPEFQSLVRDGRAAGQINELREVSLRHRKIFHALPHVFGEAAIRDQCRFDELEQLARILAVHEKSEDSISTN